MTRVPSAAELIHLGMDTSVGEIVVAVLRPGRAWAAPAACLDGGGLRRGRPVADPKGGSDRVKTGKRDPARLALTHRAGLLAAIRVPSPAEEAVRDLVRARADLAGDRKRMQQRLNAVLLRHGRAWRGGSKWAYAHRAWAGKQVFAGPALAETLTLYRGALEAREAELAAVDRQLPAWAQRIRSQGRWRGWAVTGGSRS
jgi:hypothetical protein